LEIAGSFFFRNPQLAIRFFFKILSYQVALFFESSAHDPIFLKILSSRIDLFPL